MKSGNSNNCKPGEGPNNKLRAEIKKILNDHHGYGIHHVYTDEEVLIIEDFFQVFSEILLTLNSNQYEK